jgi:hypothetical protein
MKSIRMIVIVLILFFVFDRLIKSVSFSGNNRLEPQATAGVSSQEIYDWVSQIPLFLVDVNR